MSVVHFGEGRFELTPGLVDRSVQAYIDGPEENKTGLVIIREPLGKTDLVTYAKSLNHGLGLQMRRYECLSLEEGAVDGMPAVLIQAKLVNEGMPMYHSLALIACHDMLLNCSVSGPYTRRERCEEIMDATLASLRFRNRDGEIDDDGAEP